jgi:putative membrane protein
MMVSNRGSIYGLLIWQWKNVLIFGGVGTAVVVAVEVFGLHWLELPALPLAVVGGALGIFTSFRTNSAYQRWWEGRQLWGRLVNSSRHFGSQVLAYLPREGRAPSALQSELVHRHIAYVHVLRCLMRLQDPLRDGAVLQAIDRDHEALGRESNLTHALLQRQLDALAAEHREGRLDGLQLQSLDETVRQLLDIQGGCERIKKTPMPRGYGFIAERLLWAYAALLPTALVHDIHWAAIPINVLVCLGFGLINEAGRVLEDPFTMFWNGLPLYALSRTIEVNLRQRLGEEALPAIPQPDARGILM